MKRNSIGILTALLLITTSFAQQADESDRYLWLEEIAGERALAWVKEKNTNSTKLLEASSNFQPIFDKTLETLNSKERIPYIDKRGEFFYNFWRDEKNVRGLWRRTSLEVYRKEQPTWETVLDLDALAKEEKENWVWSSVACLYPKYERCLVRLSRGGADATVTREFDVISKTFVKGGFELPEAKGGMAWRDVDTVYVFTDFGPGSLTTSGYPRIVKEWKRGTPLTDAKVIFEGETSDVSVGGFAVLNPKYRREYVRRAVTFRTSEIYLRQGDKLKKLDVPPDAIALGFLDYILVTLRSEWKVGGKTYPQDAALVMDFDRFLKGERDFHVLFEPSQRKSLAGVTVLKNYILVNELADFRHRIYEWQRADGKWVRRLVSAPPLNTLTVNAVDPEESDDYFLTGTDFLTPSTLYLARAGSSQYEKLKSSPAFFDARGLAVRQFEATSKDGAKVHYFVIMAENAKFDGTNPTLLYGYGGFQISQTPAYNPTAGHAWLKRGGVYVIANIRGGGEFGSRWHQAALKEKRQKAFDDFIAVAEDLVARKIASPQRLAINGGSNGGLLVGAVMVQRPDLFKAVVCSVPLLDMRRYNKLLAGASWTAEYGNPDDPKEWEYIKAYSPYQNVSKDKKYPKVFFTTSTRDDRVHPGHARKMAVKMLEQGHDVLYYENTEGGHGGAANNKQAAYRTALIYSFLWQELQ